MADVDDPWEPPFYGPSHVSALKKFARRDAIKKAIDKGTVSDAEIVSVREFEGFEDVDARRMGRIGLAPDEAKPLLWYLFDDMVHFRSAYKHYSSLSDYQGWGLQAVQVFLSQLSDGLTADEIRHEILENWGVKGTKMYDAQALTSQYGSKRRLFCPALAKEMDERRAELEAAGMSFHPSYTAKGIQCTQEAWERDVADRKRYSN